MPWTPSDLSNLELWLDASDAATITESSGSVSQWDDKSGNSNHAVQTDAGLKPTTSANTLNGLNAIYFDSTERMTIPYTADMNAGDCMLFVVCESLDATIISTPYSQIGSGYKGFFVQATSTGQHRLRYGDGLGWENIAGSKDIGPKLFDVEVNSSTGTEFFEESVSKGTNASIVTANSTEDAVVGAYNDVGTYPFDGNIAEIILVTSILSDADLNKARGYLAHKWGLNWQLEHTHPYYSDGSLFGYSNLWSPTHLTAELWLDAASRSTLTLVGTEVSQWDDKSGNDNHGLQAVGSQQMRSNTLEQNGLNVLRAYSTDGVDLTTPINAAVFNIFIVRMATGSGTCIDLASDTAGAHSGIHESGSTATTLSADFGSPTYYKDGAVITPADRGAMWDEYIDGNYHIIGYISADTSHADWDSMRIGEYNISGEYAEIIITAGTLSTADRESIEGYLAHKWGLESSLDSGHPYKSSAPTGGASALLVAMLTHNHFAGGVH